MIETLRKPTTVGEILTEEYLVPLSITQKQLADVMGLSRKTISELCTGKRRLTIDDAIKLGDLFETSSDFWLNLQSATDRWEARQKRQNLKNHLLPIVELLHKKPAAI